MKLSLEPAAAADVSTLADVVAEAITDPGQGNPGGEWISACWPRINEPAGRAKTAERLGAILQFLPKGSIVKVVDDDNASKIVGMAIWNFYNEIPEALPGLDLGDDFWLSEDERLYGEHIQNETNAEFLRHYKALGAPLIALEVFVISPSYKRRGAGALLMAEGVARAAARNAAMFVNATVPGEKLYERYGFVMAKEGRYQIPQGKWTENPRSGLGCMVRERPMEME